eukprot:5143282-Alexandrium_andersonii.AAC.1
MMLKVASAEKLTMRMTPVDPEALTLSAGVGIIAMRRAHPVSITPRTEAFGRSIRAGRAGYFR